MPPSFHFGHEQAEMGGKAKTGEGEKKRESRNRKARDETTGSRTGKVKRERGLERVREPERERAKNGRETERERAG